LLIAPINSQDLFDELRYQITWQYMSVKMFMVGGVWFPDNRLILPRHTIQSAGALQQQHWVHDSFPAGAEQEEQNSLLSCQQRSGIQVRILLLCGVL